MSEVEINGSGYTTIVQSKQIKKFGGLGPAFLLASLEPVYTEIIRQKNIVEANIPADKNIGTEALNQLTRSLQELQNDLMTLQSIVMSICQPIHRSILLSNVLQEQTMLCAKYK
jgi:hypothetical protein